MSDFIDARAGDVAAYDRFCEGLSAPSSECSDCGEHHGDRCPWRETCSECGREDVDMARDRLCLDCEESQQRSAELQRREDFWDGYGDYIRDQQKDDRL